LNAETLEEARRTIASDIFSFGRVILELTTGQPPFFDVEKSGRVALLVMDGEFPSRLKDETAVARGLNDGMWELAEDCWRYEPSKRPSATEVFRRLQIFQQSRI